MENDDDNDDYVEPPVYALDEATLELVEIALNCMVQLGDAQMDAASRDNLLLIADEIAARFAITSYHVEEEITDDGETIYKPRGGVFNDLDEEEDKTLD
jgi:hypothetical protein